MTTREGGTTNGPQDVRRDECCGACACNRGLEVLTVGNEEGAGNRGRLQRRASPFAACFAPTSPSRPCPADSAQGLPKIVSAALCRSSTTRPTAATAGLRVTGHPIHGPKSLHCSVWAVSGHRNSPAVSRVVHTLCPTYLSRPPARWSLSRKNLGPTTTTRAVGTAVSPSSRHSSSRARTAASRNHTKPLMPRMPVDFLSFFSGSGFLSLRSFRAAFCTPPVKSVRLGFINWRVWGKISLTSAKVSLPLRTGAARRTWVRS